MVLVIVFTSELEKARKIPKLSMLHKRNSFHLINNNIQIPFKTQMSYIIFLQLNLTTKYITQIDHKKGNINYLS